MKGLVILMGSNSNSHLTLEDRKIIEQGINNNETKASIADKLGKDFDYAKYDKDGKIQTIEGLDK